MQKTPRGCCLTRCWSKTHNFPLIKCPAAVGGGEGRSTFLQVPGLVAVLGGAADGDGVDAVGVAITGAVIALSAAIPRCPDENGPQSPATLQAQRGWRVRGDVCPG